MFLLYSLALSLALPLWWLVHRLRRGPRPLALRQRLGRFPAGFAADSRPAIWIHAVSVGEVLAVASLVGKLRARHPARQVVVSTTTVAGQQLARQRFGAENVFYFPLDFAFAIRRCLRALRPELVVLAETEFWPNFLRLAKRSGVHIAVVNARISDRSLPRYRQWRPLVRGVLRHVDVFLAQSPADARRLTEIGAPADRIHVSGNLKFDLPAASDAPVLSLLRAALDRGRAGPVFVAGSTMQGEEELLLAAFRDILCVAPSAVLILAPRHPERFPRVAELIAASGLPSWRRSTLLADAALNGGILLLDSVGELAAVYSLATVAFVGGSLVPHGGHNILEPAQHGVPIVVGPHTGNFREIIVVFRQAGALVESNPESFSADILLLLQDPKRRVELGGKATEVFRACRGATGRTLEHLDRLLRDRDSAVLSPEPAPNLEAAR